jgi:hypothetical protein
MEELSHPDAERIRGILDRFPVSPAVKAAARPRDGADPGPTAGRPRVELRPRARLLLLPRSPATTSCR